MGKDKDESNTGEAFFPFEDHKLSEEFLILYKPSALKGITGTRGDIPLAPIYAIIRIRDLRSNYNLISPLGLLQGFRALLLLPTNSNHQKEEDEVVVDLVEERAKKGSLCPFSALLSTAAQLVDDSVCVCVCVNSTSLACCVATLFQQLWSELHSSESKIFRKSSYEVCCVTVGRGLSSIVSVSECISPLVVSHTVFPVMIMMFTFLAWPPNVKKAISQRSSYLPCCMITKCIQRSLPPFAVDYVREGNDESLQDDCVAVCLCVSANEIASLELFVS